MIVKGLILHKYKRINMFRKLCKKWINCLIYDKAQKKLIYYNQQLKNKLKNKLKKNNKYKKKLKLINNKWHHNRKLKLKNKNKIKKEEKNLILRQKINILIIKNCKIIRA